jgi:hypothetical protein
MFLLEGRGRFLTGLMVLALAACGGGEPPAEEAAQPEETPAAEPVSAPGQPDTTAAALWAYLQDVSYQANWELWPGKGEKYEGQEPHGALLTTYLNPAAMEALTTGARVMPSGAIIVKENYMPDGALAATTVMYKVDGYNPDHNDWFWLKQNADQTVDVEGRGQMCQACHLAVAGNDYIYTGSLGG